MFSIIIHRAWALLFRSLSEQAAGSCWSCKPGRTREKVAAEGGIRVLYIHVIVKICVIIKTALHTCKQKDKRCKIVPHIVVHAVCLGISYICGYRLIYIHTHPYIINFGFLEVGYI